ncbi:unnamed protein product [Soboliphyme baturini]|uniref:Uncharacterized protein n=1 Tax=Soboliphyme baturini TaxID=241478 RepID=A0A183INW9_9BILA|nr:unnamed protein product [Soboliphyme baturini]
MVERCRRVVGSRKRAAFEEEAKKLGRSAGRQLGNGQRRDSGGQRCDPTIISDDVTTALQQIMNDDVRTAEDDPMAGSSLTRINRGEVFSGLRTGQGLCVLHRFGDVGQSKIGCLCLPLWHRLKVEKSVDFQADLTECRPTGLSVDRLRCRTVLLFQGGHAMANFLSRPFRYVGSYCQPLPVKCLESDKSQKASKATTHELSPRMTWQVVMDKAGSPTLASVLKLVFALFPWDSGQEASDREGGHAVSIEDTKRGKRNGGETRRSEGRLGWFLLQSKALNV